MTKATDKATAKGAQAAKANTAADQAPEVPGSAPQEGAEAEQGAETDDPVNGEEMRFDHFPPESVDKYRSTFFKFDTDGATIDVKYIRRWAKGEREGLEHACIECEQHPSGAPVLLPGNLQLWEAFGAMEANKMNFDLARFRITRDYAKMDPKDPNGKPKFVHFVIGCNIPIPE